MVSAPRPTPLLQLALATRGPAPPPPRPGQNSALSRGKRHAPHARRTLARRAGVISLPHGLRGAVAFDADLLNAVFACVTRRLQETVASLAAEQGVTGQPAGVLHLQRFQGDLGVNPHGHYLLSDAVFVAEGPPRPHADARARAVPTRAPTRAELQATVDAIERDVVRLLARRVASEDPDAARAGELLQRLSRATPCAEHRMPAPDAGHAPARIRAPLCARSPGGFDLHAGVTVPAHDRDGLERLLRYLARPPVALDRLSRRANGNVIVTLKRPSSRGAHAVEYTPLAFIARLAALVPAPRLPLARLIGAVAPNAALRPLVVPIAPPSTPERPTSPERPGRFRWAALLRRVFGIDAPLCPCGGRFRVVAVIETPDVIQAVAAALIASGHLAPHRAPRGPPRNRRRRTPPPSTRRTRSSRSPTPRGEPPR